MSARLENAGVLRIAMHIEKEKDEIMKFTRKSACHLALLGATGIVSAQPFYHLESATMLKSAAPDWDYVTLDAPRGHLFIGRRGDGMAVYDVKRNKLLRTLDNAADAGAAMLVPEFDKGYTANGDGSTTVFRLSTLKTLARVKFGEDADAGVYDPVSKQIAFTMGDSGAIAFVDAKTSAVLGTLAVDSKKLDGAAPDGAGNLFMALRDRNLVVKIDVAAPKLIEQWPTGACTEPTGLSYDAANKRIFVGCRGANPMLAVLDADTGKVVATLPIGRGNDGVVYDAGTHNIYTSNGVDGNLVIYHQIDKDNYQLVEATTTRAYARTMAFDPATKKVYSVTAQGTADPARKINTAVATFYPNHYFANTFTVLTYSLK